MSTKTEDKKSKEAKGEKSVTDQWRDAEGDACAKEQAAEAARERANELGSSLAQKLIENHGGACVEFNGVKYAPKAGATRKMKDGTVKEPRHPYQLVRTKDRTPVEI